MGCLLEAVARATRVDLINLTMNYSTRRADALAVLRTPGEAAPEGQAWRRRHSQGVRPRPSSLRR